MGENGDGKMGTVTYFVFTAPRLKLKLRWIVRVVNPPFNHQGIIPSRNVRCNKSPVQWKAYFGESSGLPAYHFLGNSCGGGSKSVDKADSTVKIQSSAFRVNLVGEVPTGPKTREQLR